MEAGKEKAFAFFSKINNFLKFESLAQFST